MDSLSSRSAARLCAPLAAFAFAIALVVPVAPSAHGADNAFVLDNAGFNGAPGTKGSGGNYDQTFAGVEIKATPDPATGTYRLRSVESDIPLSWEYYPGNTVTGNGAFSMDGTYNPKTNELTGTFTLENEAGGTIKGSAGKQALTFAMIWKGDVTGSVTDNVAELWFSGSDTIKCTLGGNDCGSTGSQGQRVWFDVSNDTYSLVPGASAAPEEVMVSGATGEVYFSGADQKDLEPASRTWVVVKPGDRLRLEVGVMLRTGSNSSLKVLFYTGARIRMQASTLFEVQKMGIRETGQADMYGRLYSGILDLYMKNWRDSGRKFEVEVDRANTSIQGTTYQIAVTDTSDVITVIEGVVAVTDKATGTTIDVGPLERATVDATGMTKVADPAPSMLPEDADMTFQPGASPSASGGAAAGPTAPPSAATRTADATPPAAATPAGATPPSVTPSPAGSVAAVVAPSPPSATQPPLVAPPTSTTGGGTGDLTIGLIAGIGLILVLAIVGLGLVARRNRSRPTGAR